MSWRNDLTDAEIEEQIRLKADLDAWSAANPEEDRLLREKIQADCDLFNSKANRHWPRDAKGELKKP